MFGDLTWDNNKESTTGRSEPNQPKFLWIFIRANRAASRGPSMRYGWQPRRRRSKITVPMTETAMDPRHPRRLEKKANIVVEFAVSSRVIAGMAV